MNYHLEDTNHYGKNKDVIERKYRYEVSNNCEIDDLKAWHQENELLIEIPLKSQWVAKFFSVNC